MLGGSEWPAAAGAAEVKSGGGRSSGRGGLAQSAADRCMCFACLLQATQATRRASCTASTCRCRWAQRRQQQECSSRESCWQQRLRPASTGTQCSAQVFSGLAAQRRRMSARGSNHNCYLAPMPMQEGMGAESFHPHHWLQLNGCLALHSAVRRRAWTTRATSMCTSRSCKRCAAAHLLPFVLLPDLLL